VRALDMTTQRLANSRRTGKRPIVTRSQSGSSPGRRFAGRPIEAQRQAAPVVVPLTCANGCATRTHLRYTPKKWIDLQPHRCRKIQHRRGRSESG
jgi:hypothetical protein